MKSLQMVFGMTLFQHPQIQKESQYIKYLCCDDARALSQWVTGIRIAKVREWVGPPDLEFAS